MDWKLADIVLPYMADGDDLRSLECMPQDADLHLSPLPALMLLHASTPRSLEGKGIVPVGSVP